MIKIFKHRKGDMIYEADVPDVPPPSEVVWAVVMLLALLVVIFV